MNFMKTILELSVYSSIMIIAVLALKAAFKGKISLRIVALMWMLVLLRLIIPFTINSPLHFDSLLEKSTASETAETEIYAAETSEAHLAEENIHFDSTVPAAQPEVNENNSANEALPESIPGERSIIQKAVELSKSISLWMYLLIIWTAGAAISALINMWSFISFNRMIKQSDPAEGLIAQATQDIRARVEIKQDVKVITCRYVAAPMTFRVLNPIIILPKTLVGRISEEKLNMILLHELCHIKRKDIFCNILWMFAKIIHWFNPLVWIGYSSYIEDIELSCDEMVNNYLNAEQSFIYSQSLIDVIRFSRNIGRLPAALSFCEDKSKLRKRVENMLKPQKKLKSAGGISLFLALIMLFTCFTTACQPTPEDLVVQNKNNGELEAAIMETAAPDEAQNTDTGNKAVWIKDELNNDTGTINIDIDAMVAPISDEKITIARLEPYSFTESEMAAMTETFFGGDIIYYDYLTSTKADYENNIIYLQQRLTLDDEELLALYLDKDITDVDEIKAHINRVIEELKIKAASAPEYGEVLEKFESKTEKWGGFYVKVDYGKDHLGYVSYDEPFAGRETFFCSAYANMRNDLAVSFDVDTEAEDFDAAKSNSQDLITRMGIEGVRLGDIHTISDEENLYYVFCFERIVGERTIDYSFEDGGYTDDYEATITVPYEKIEVWMNGAEPIKFYWRNPHRVIDIINENAAVQIDYFKALELGINQIYAKYAYLQNQDMKQEVFVTITGIEFVMVRMKEKDSEYYISVPAWKIYGDASAKRPQEMIDYLTERAEEDPYSNIDLSEYVSLTEHTGPNIVTVNALDGSIIDMGKGY